MSKKIILLTSTLITIFLWNSGAGASNSGEAGSEGAPSPRDVQPDITSLPYSRLVMTTIGYAKQDIRELEDEITGLHEMLYGNRNWEKTPLLRAAEETILVLDAANRIIDELTVEKERLRNLPRL